jgi:hypothetical protein
MSRSPNPMPYTIKIEENNISDFLSTIEMEFKRGYRFDMNNPEGIPRDPSVLGKLFRSEPQYSVVMYLFGEYVAETTI